VKVKSNKITVHPFAEDAFVKMVRADGGGAVTDQVRYLARYLAKLGVKTVVRESLYVDRHYMDEYALFYSRMLAPPPNTVTRFHFFEKAFNRAALTRWMTRKFQGEEVEPTITSEGGRYQGFSCIRPIEECPIGRTVVARWQDGPTPRDIWAVGKYTAHIGNLRFDVTGIPFQQQEAAVGACATVAIWSALAHAARQDGMRAPTPAEIAEAVERPEHAQVRGPLPPTIGFSASQVSVAIQRFGFTPAVVGGDRPEQLAFALHTYLQSRIPVVLILRGGGKGHAVTATGFQLSGSDHPKLEADVATRSMQIRKIYVHDDRVGPYARASLTPFQVTDVEGMPAMHGMRFEIEMVGGTAEQWVVDMIVAPVYPKVRLSVRSLMAIATGMQPLIEKAVGEADAFDLRVDVRYARAAEYLASLAKKVDPKDAAAMASRVSLPRWCAVVRWSLKDEPLLEFVYDTTDIMRGDGSGVLLTVVAVSGRVKAEVTALGNHFGVPTA
jgi:hypothetical protein